MNRKVRLALSATLAAICLALIIVGIGGEGCEKEALREAQGSTTLPGCMGLELASPPKKFSQPALLPSFSRDGNRVRFQSEGALADTPGLQNYGGDRYITTRGTDGWATSATTPPASAQITFGGPFFGNLAALTPDFSRWVGFGSTAPQMQVGVTQLFTGGLDGSFEPLSPVLVPINDSGTTEPQLEVSFLQLSGSSADLASSVFRVKSPAIAYFTNDPRSLTVDAAPGGDRNSYLAFLDALGEPALQLLARDKDGAVWGGRCGAHLGGEETLFNQGAISPDGSLIYLTTRPSQPFDEGTASGPQCSTANPLRILARDNSDPENPVITEIAPGGGPAEAGDDLFQGASADGTKVYFTTPRKLTGSDTDADTDPCAANLGASKGCDLYLYDSAKAPGSQLTQVSKGTAQADVLSGITAVSGDGSRAYFVAKGVLTADENPEEAVAQAGEPNLYLYETEGGQLSFIATLAAADQGRMWGTKGTLYSDAYASPLHGATETEGGDGHVLAFASKAPLTADDLDGSHRDVFRYDADTDSLVRVSKAAPGGSDNGPFDATVNPAIAEIHEFNFAEATRWMSEDGEIIAFATEEALIEGDEDSSNNPYVWDAGNLGASFAPITEPPAVSPAQDQVAFVSVEALIPQNVDFSPDVFVARRDGGFPLPPPPPDCDPLKEGSCRTFSLAPLAGAPATTATTSGNVKEPKCKKGFVRKGGKCVKKKPRKHKGKRAKKSRGGRR